MQYHQRSLPLLKEKFSIMNNNILLRGYNL
jgi:hypothetical protein